MREGRKERSVLFNGALNTFYLRLNGVGHMVKDHSYSERGNPLRVCTSGEFESISGLSQYGNLKKIIEGWKCFI